MITRRITAIPFLIKTVLIIFIVTCLKSHILLSLNEEQQKIFERITSPEEFTAIVTRLAQSGGLEFRDSSGYTPLLFWTLNSNKQKAEILLSAGANLESRMPEPDRRTPLHMAVSSADQPNGGDLVALLLSKGADVTTVEQRGNLPIHWVIRIDNLNTRMRVLALLVLFGADINSRGEIGNTLMHMQVKKFDLSGVLALRDLFGIELDLSVRNQAGQTATEYADSFLFTDILAALQQKPKIAGLLSNNANTLDAVGLTPLMHAVIANNTALISDLIKNRGALVDLTSKTPFGFTALDIAVLRNNTAMVEYLISSKADLSKRNGLGKTPLHIILYIRDPNTRISMLDFLLRLGAKPEAQDAKGNTLLHDIILAQDTKLLAHIGKKYSAQFSPSIQNSSYDTPRSLAIKMGSAEIKALLGALK